MVPAPSEVANFIIHRRQLGNIDGDPPRLVAYHTVGSAFLFFGVPPVTAVAEKTVYASKRDLMDAS